MKKLVLSVLMTGAVAGAMAAADSGLEMWSDPAFQKAFMGSYGMNADIEPRVTTVEREQMEKVMDAMTEDQAKAEKLLLKFAKPEACAIFDFTLANIYFQQEEMGKAANWYRSAIEKFPNFRRAHKNLGMIYVRSGIFADAIEPLTKSIELGASDGLTYGLLGYCYANQGDQIAAEAAYRQAVLLQPKTLDWKLGLARTFFKQQKFEEASVLCGQLIKENPARDDLWLLQANAYLGMKQTLKAAENFEYVDALGKAKVSTLNTLGDIYVNEGMMDMAAEAYRKALDLDPDQPVKRSIRNAEVLVARSATDEAKELIAAIQEHAGARMEQAEKSKLLKLQARIAVTEGADDAQAHILEEVVKLDPLDGEALIMLGRHYGNQGEAEKAVFYFERAEGMEQFEADARIRHAQLLVKESKFKEAVPLLKRALELKPRDDLSDYLKQVERIAKVR